MARDDDAWRAEGDGESLLPLSENEVLLLADESGLLVQGPQAAVEEAIRRLLAPLGDQGGAAVTRQSIADASALGASVGGVALTGGEYLRLTAESAAKVQEFGPQKVGRAMRGYVRGDGGRIAGQLTFEPVSLAAEQALAMQTAAVSLALRSAIADVQKAVEEVADTVDDIRRMQTSRQVGDVVGNYRHLQLVVEGATRHRHLTEADWDSVASSRQQIYRDLETLRSYVQQRIDKTAESKSVPKRAQALEKIFEPGDVADALRLMLVAEQAMHLYEFLRIARIKAQEPDKLQGAVEGSREQLLRQRESNSEVADKLDDLVERLRILRPLDVRHVFSRDDLAEVAVKVHNRVREFRAAARLELRELPEVTEPEFADARAELKQHAVRTGKATKEITASTSRAAAHLARTSGERVAGGVAGQVRKIRKGTNEPPSAREP